VNIIGSAHPKVNPMGQFVLVGSSRTGVDGVGPAWPQP
jgi:hypothetical protein